MSDQRAEQRQAGAARPLRVEAARCALLVIDVQTRLAAAMDPPAFAACQRNIRILIELARRLNWPIVVSEQYPRGLGPTVPELASALPSPQLPSPQLTMFTKTAFACTEQEGFSSVLEQVARPQWLVAGMETHVCVWQTVRGLLERGLAVQVVADAVLSRTAANQQIGLQLCEQAGAVITSTETAAFDALVRAGSDEFKAISQLVK